MRGSLLGSIVAFSLLAFSTIAAAATTVPNTFAAGSPARAAEVNANFQAMATAIDTLVAQNNALAARVDRLDGTTPITVSDLVGTYKYQGMQISSNGSSTSIGTVTLNLDGTCNISFTSTSLANTLTVYASANTTGMDTAVAKAGSSAFNQDFTWTLSGSSLTVVGVGTFQLLAGGKMAVSSSVSGSTAGFMFVIK